MTYCGFDVCPMCVRKKDRDGGEGRMCEGGERVSCACRNNSPVLCTFSSSHGWQRLWLVFNDACVRN